MKVNAPFLPVLPAGDLESWLRNTCKLTNDSHKCSPVFGGARGVPVSVSNSQDGPQTAQLSDPIPYGVKGGRREDMPVLRDVNSIRFFLIFFLIQKRSMRPCRNFAVTSMLYCPESQEMRCCKPGQDFTDVGMPTMT